MSTLIEPRIEKMQRATRDPVVALHKFNKLRSRHPDDLVLVFEGYDDPVFYSVLADRCGFSEHYLVLVADGKDMVLGLRRLIAESAEAKRGTGVAFLIDNDYDGLKGHVSGPDLYCTPTYSIENLVADPSVLSKILYNEFKLQDPDLMPDVERNVSNYRRLIADFTKQVFDVNLLIYFGRIASIATCGARIVEIEESATKLFHINRETLQITSSCSGELAKTIVKFSSDIDLKYLDGVRSDFQTLDPLTQWRGKYWLELLRVFVDILQEDRNSTTPKHFKAGKGKVRLNLGSDTKFRILASVCGIPDCARAFFSSLPAAALH